MSSWPDPGPSNKHQQLSELLKTCHDRAIRVHYSPGDQADECERSMHRAVWAAHETGATWREIAQAVGYSPGHLAKVAKHFNQEGLL